MTRSTPENSAERLRELIAGPLAAQVIGVAAELKIADLIQDGTRTSAELAAVTGAHELSLHRLLRTLSALGVTAEPEPGRFALTDLGAQLRSDSPDSLYALTRMFCSPAILTAWQGLAHTVRTGERGFDQVFGTDFYGYLAGQPELSALFNDAMGQLSRVSAEQIAAGHDFTDVKTVVDLGGGDGTLLAAVLSAHSHLRGVVFDTASGVAEAHSVLAGAGVADRCEVRAGSFFEEIPTDGDLYLIKSVLQDWDDEGARAMLRTCHAGMPATATLVIFGVVLPETASPAKPIDFLVDLHLLLSSGGRERTESQLRNLLEDSGFAVRSVAHDAAGGLSTIQATVSHD